MPVDNTKVISPRRTTKKLTEEEIKDIEQKRLRGELACAECRRLKLRCDKNVPCGSCYRRGCESICPLGILTGGQGTRFILADTEQLHEKIYEMSNRIRQLEDALAILQSSVSDQRHPLLSDELLKVKFGSESINVRETPTSDEDHAPQKSIDALGTLTLGSSGKLQYLGRSAGSETLMMKADDEGEDSSDDDQDTGPASLDMFAEVQKLAELFPFTSKSRPNSTKLELLETFLPSMEVAVQLCTSYIDHAAFFFRPIKREELFDTLLPGVYNAAAVRRAVRLDAGSSPGSDFDEGHMNMKRSCTPHALASLYFIFALGALLDLERAPFNSEAERFCDLGRAGLSLRSVYESANMDTVKAMGLMATYHTLAGKKYSRDSAWCIMSFTAKLAQSIGLHRDSARWNMDPITVQKRRNLFWEVFSADVSHSLALGRPPAIHLSYVDCEFPTDEDATLGKDSEHQTGFWRMKHHFGKDIYNSVADATLIAHAPSYNTILDLDKKVREICFPASFNPYVTKEVGEEIFNSSSLSLRDFYASQNRTVTMIYLHRSFFAQAMLDHPTNPLLSPFAPSFLTAYRCASVIIKASAHLFERCAAMAMRLWFLMYHTFSAAVIVGTVVTRSPNSNIASIAMKDFRLAVSLFERTAPHSQRAKTALGVLLKLREKATYVQHSPNLSAASPSPSSPIDIFATDDIEDDLAIFGGQTRVLDRKGRQGQTQSQTQTQTQQPPPNLQSNQSAFSYVHLQQPQSHQGSPPVPSPFELDKSQVHPSLISYLNREPPRNAGAQNVAPLAGGDGGRFFPSQLEGQSSGHLIPQPTNLADMREYGGGMSRGMMGLNTNTGIGLLGSEGYYNTPQVQQRPGGYMTSMGGYQNPPGYGYNNLPNMGFNRMGVPPTFPFRTSGNNVMDPAGVVEMGLSSESGMDAGWLTFMKDCGIMDVTE
ncbi:hypothetical protein BYT27DRAFT_7203180 [Phlegmacium glaucopus]|nr:hypothetical protein BYT27DRAFT_7203180 [Phlegmacium glaucopus]